MEIYGNPWKSMEIYGKAVETHGLKAMETYGFPKEHDLHE